MSSGWFDYTEPHNHNSGSLREVLREEVLSVSGSLREVLREELLSVSGSLREVLREEVRSVSGSLREEVRSVSGSLREEVLSVSGSLNAVQHPFAIEAGSFTAWQRVLVEAGKRPKTVEKAILLSETGPALLLQCIPSYLFIYDSDHDLRLSKHSLKCLTFSAQTC